MSVEVCPRCHKGKKVENVYITKDGVPFDDSYCGYCGRNWPKPPQPKEQP